VSTPKASDARTAQIRNMVANKVELSSASRRAI